MKTPVSKNEELTVTVEDLTYEGMGVAKVDGYPLFQGLFRVKKLKRLWSKHAKILLLRGHLNGFQRVRTGWKMTLNKMA